MSRKTADLSGGQKQLVNLCALLCFRPKLLLLDEPFSQLDPESTWRVVEILQRLRRYAGSFQVPVTVPEPVWEACLRLAADGYDRFVIR